MNIKATSNRFLNVRPLEGIQKINQILIFIDKKYRKKIINIYGLLNQIKQAVYKNKIYCVYFRTAYILKFLILLKTNNIIFNFYNIPVSFIKVFLLFNKTYTFLNRLVLIYFHFTRNTNDLIIKSISKPKRFIYITWVNLYQLSKHDEKEHLYILNTSHGLITHYQAHKLKLGGQVLCVIY